MTDAIVTTIIGPGNSFRSLLHRKFVAGARFSDYDTVVVYDAGINSDTLRILKSSGAHIYEQEQRGFGNAFRESVGHALELGKYVAYSEPEKYSYVSEIHKTTEPLEAELFDAVVPQRKTLDGYPTIQQATESMGNSFFLKLTGVPLDVYFGPKNFNKKAARVFLDYGDANFEGKVDTWDAHIVPVFDMLGAGMKVGSVPVNYLHPKEQLEAEENDPLFMAKRFEQLHKVSNALLRRRVTSLSLD